MSYPIPDRWLDYKPIGEPIKGTRIIAFKVPLKPNVLSSLKDSNTKLDIVTLLKMVPKLGLVIDLTNTRKYYDPLDFSNNGVEYLKLMIPGREIPPEESLKTFRNWVQKFLEKNKNNDKLIGVHCTHGVNRTGLLICHYMINELKIDPKYAIKDFEAARGHLIERREYVNFLYNSKDKKTCSRNSVEKSIDQCSTRSSKYYDKSVVTASSSSSNYTSWRQSNVTPKKYTSWRQSNVTPNNYSSFSSYSRKQRGVEVPSSDNSRREKSFDDHRGHNKSNSSYISEISGTRRTSRFSSNDVHPRRRDSDTRDSRNDRNGKSSNYSRR